MDNATLKKRYPERAKLIEVLPEAQIIGKFLNLSEYTLCKWDDDFEEYIPTMESIETILAKYFDIDLKKVEQECESIREELTKENQ